MIFLFHLCPYRLNYVLKKPPCGSFGTLIVVSPGLTCLFRFSFSYFKLPAMALTLVFKGMPFLLMINCFISLLSVESDAPAR